MRASSGDSYEHCSVHGCTEPVVTGSHWCATHRSHFLEAGGGLHKAKPGNLCAYRDCHDSRLVNDQYCARHAEAFRERSVPALDTGEPEDRIVEQRMKLPAALAESFGPPPIRALPEPVAVVKPAPQPKPAKQAKRPALATQCEEPGCEKAVFVNRAGQHMKVCHDHWMARLKKGRRRQLATEAEAVLANLAADVEQPAVETITAPLPEPCPICGRTLAQAAVWAALNVHCQRCTPLAAVMAS